MIKTILLPALLLINCFCVAQMVITPSPASINSGTITLTYGAQNDYSLFDPQGANSLFLYTGLETDGVASTWDYHDDFNDVSTLTAFNYDNSVGAFVAQIDAAGRTYLEEPNLNITTLPAGLQVNDFYFIILSVDLSRQSADLMGSTYGWQGATLSTGTVNQQNLKITAVNDQLYFNRSGVYQIETYNIIGQRVAFAKQVNVQHSYPLHHLANNQLFITKVTSGRERYTIKHIR